MKIFDKNNSNRIFNIMSLIILCLGILCVIGLCVLYSVKSTVTPQAELTTAADTTLNPYVQSSVILGETEDAGIEYQDKIIFVGDSTTHHLIASESLSDGQNTKQVWTPTSGTLLLDTDINTKTIYCPQTNTEITISAAAGLFKPEYMIITLGVNGSGGAEKDKFSACYKKLIDAIKDVSPDTKIILQSVFPVTAEYSAENNGITNAKIDIINQWIIQIASDCDCKYLDTEIVLKDSSGALIKEYNTEYHNDGYHIWKAGYSAVLEYIRTHAYQD